MIKQILSLNLLTQSLIAGLFTYSITLLGASIVLIIKKMNKNFLDYMLGLSSGIMLAASIFSLLNPAIELSKEITNYKILFVVLGLISGCLFLLITNLLFDHKLSNKSNLKRSIMLMTSVTIHNIPEGMAIGVAFGSFMNNIPGTNLLSAWIIALGIGIQNFPEGLIVSLPLRREGISKGKAFFFGQLSAIVEPIFSVLGALLVIKVRILMPFLLSFAAGAMLYVVIIDLIPESQINKNKNLVTLFTILGFILMMVLDVLLG